MTRKFIGRPTRSKRAITGIRLPSWYSQFRHDLLQNVSNARLNALFVDLEKVSNVVLSGEAKKNVPYLLLSYCAEVAAENSHPIAADTKKQIEGIGRKAAQLREELERTISSDHLALYALLKHYSKRHTLVDRLPRSLRELEQSTSEILSDFELHTIGGGGVSKLPGFARFVADAGRIFSKLGGNVAANSSPNRSNALSLFNPFVRFCWRLMQEVPEEARYSSSQQAFGAAVKRALKTNTKA